MVRSNKGGRGGEHVEAFRESDVPASVRAELQRYDSNGNAVCDIIVSGILNLANGRFFLLRDDHEAIVAMAHVEESAPTASLSWICAEPKNRGHGRLLIESIEEDYRVNHPHIHTLQLVPLFRETTAFYHRLGYKEGDGVELEKRLRLPLVPAAQAGGSPMPRAIPIHEWVAMEAALRKEVGVIPQTVRTSSEMACSRNQVSNRISFNECAFGNLDRAIQDTYTDAESIFRSRVDPADALRQLNAVPSMACVFQNTAHVDFYDTYFVFRADEGMEDGCVNRMTRDYYHPMLHAALHGLSKKPRAVVAFIDSATLFHACVLLFWMDDGDLHVAIYDAMYVKREQYELKTAIQVTRNVVSAWAKAQGHGFVFHDLTKFCVQTSKGIHCMQYVMNAEYCLMYSLHFLYLFAKNGGDTSPAAFKKVIEQSYIVDDPHALTRDNEDATRLFRIVMMAFILNVLGVYYTMHHANSPRLLELVQKHTRIVEDTGYHPMNNRVMEIVMKNKIATGNSRTLSTSHFTEAPDFGGGWLPSKKTRPTKGRR